MTRDQLVYRATASVFGGMRMDDLERLAKYWHCVVEDCAALRDVRKTFREWDRIFNRGKTPWSEMG
jgi:hypothetical protein